MNLVLLNQQSKTINKYLEDYLVLANMDIWITSKNSDPINQMNGNRSSKNI